MSIITATPSISIICIAPILFLFSVIAIFFISTLELRNAKIYGLIEQKHLKDKEVLRPKDLNFCIS